MKMLYSKHNQMQRWNSFHSYEEKVFNFCSLGWLTVNTKTYTQIPATRCDGSWAVAVAASPSTPATRFLTRMPSMSLLLKMTEKFK